MDKDSLELDPEYQLVWPRDLFVREAQEVLLRYGPRDERLALVFREAFYGEGPARALQAGARTLIGLTAPSSRDPWANDESEGSSVSTPFSDLTDRMAVQAFLKGAPRLRTFAEPRPYWASRQNPRGGGPHLDQYAVRQHWLHLVLDLEQRGYFAKAAPRPCVDGDPHTQRATEDQLRDELEERLGRDDLWPVRKIETWDDGDFFSAVEVFHDLVARPRSRWFHDFDHCGWHFGEFNIGTGQALYRAQVNTLFARSAIPWRLASSGVDRGRLVQVTTAPQNDLIERVLASEAALDKKSYAIALYRSRDATPEHKRSACLTLAGLLEAARDDLKRELLSEDERALFTILNKFAIRHQRLDQRTDYRPAFLDWLFWWELATVDLLDQLSLQTRPPS